MELQFGEGGDDSKKFVQELFSAYCKYADSLGFKSELLSSSDGQIVAKFVGEGVWNAFQYESGKHCVQRQPDNNKGQKHTSMVAVAVMPMRPDTDYEALPDDEIEIKTQGGHGPGGQHQNKTESAVRMTHTPTGIQVFINGRDQHSNKKEARKILTAKVNDLYAEQVQAEYDEQRKQQVDGGGRGNKIRTYNLIKGRAVDHRSGAKTTQVKRVLEKGEFQLLIE